MQKKHNQPDHLRSPYVFKLNQPVKVKPEGRTSSSSTIKELFGQTLVVRDHIALLPGEQEIAGHTQRVKVGVVGESWTSHWLSGAWFEPA